MRDLAGKRVLLTGGAQGIGLAIARRFAAEGAELVLTDLHRAALEQASRGLRDEGAKVAFEVMDVTRPESIAETRDRLRASGTPIDLLVNNAGVVFGGPFTEVALDRHRLTIDVNVQGVIAVTHAFLPDLAARPAAHLVQIASASGFIGLPFGSTYAASKWAVIGFSESIRLELGMRGLRHVGMTIVCPSYVSTGLFDGARPPRTTRVLTPERLADLTVRAVRRGRTWVRTPWLVKITPPLKGLLPTPVFDRISWLFGATTSMVDWRGHAPGGSPPR